MENKLSYKLQSILVLIYLAVIPLLYKADPVEFHNQKLVALYSVIGGIFLLSVLLGKDFSKKYRLSFKTFKWERRLFTVAILFMFMSLFNNLLVMQSFVNAGYISTKVFFGAGPNYLSIFFYWFCILMLTALIPVWHYLNKGLIKIVTVASLSITGLLIAYQVFINDFIGVARTYLFGFGNSNYTPDPFALVGLMLIIPLLFSKKINWIETFVGIFMFVIVLLSLSRAAFMGLFVSVLFTIIYLAVTKKLAIKRTIILAVAGVAFLATSIFVLSSIGDSGIVNDFKSLLDVLSGDKSFATVSSLRVDLWKATIAEMNSKPIIWFLGNGQSVYIWTAETTSYLVTNVHNMYLDILFSGGIVVFITFITLLVRQFIFALRLVKYDTKNIVLLSGMVFILVKWMFNSLNAIHSPFIIMVFVLISYRYMIMKNEEKVD